jgi:hypothetical protein
MSLVNRGKGVHMLTGLPALETTDWSKLHHAYGRATDTPDHLRALLREDLETRNKALSHLWSAIIHQGTPWTATGPVALVVAGFLSDERIDRGPPIRDALLEFLASVAEAAERAGCSMEELERMAAFDIDPFLDSDDDEALYGGNEVAADSFYARSILGCIRVAPELMKVMLEGMTSANPRVRACAAMGAVILAKTELLRHHSKDLESRLRTMAASTQNTDERSALVLSLGDLGYSPVEFLEDPSPPVRMCAALAPGLAADPRAINELLQSLEYHAKEMDAWFVEKPPQFAMRPRFPVVARLIQQVRDFDRLTNAAVAVAGVTTKHCVDFDWGPLLVAAFSDGSGIIRTDAQRRYLQALLKNSELWASLYGNPLKWFKQAGLAYDCEVCAGLVKKM